MPSIAYMLVRMHLQISDDFCTTIDNVLDANDESVFQSQQDTKSSSRYDRDGLSIVYDCVG